MSGIQAEPLSRQGRDTAGSIPRVQAEALQAVSLCPHYHAVGYGHWTGLGIFLEHLK
jgi:hypothetical protein